MNAAQTTLMIPTEPSSAGNLSFWASMPGWTASEMAALLLTLDPESKAENETHHNYQRLRKLISRCMKMDILSVPVDPVNALEWAISNGVAIPQDLRKEVEKDGHLKDWRSMFMELEDKKLPATGPKKLHGKLRATFQCVLLGLAIKHYHHGTMKPTIVAKSIATDLYLLGLKQPGWQTIHTHLKLASKRQQDKFEKDSD